MSSERSGPPSERPRDLVDLGRDARAPRARGRRRTPTPGSTTRPRRGPRARPASRPRISSEETSASAWAFAREVALAERRCPSSNEKAATATASATATAPTIATSRRERTPSRGSFIAASSRRRARSRSRARTAATRACGGGARCRRRACCRGRSLRAASAAWTSSRRRTASPGAPTSRARMRNSVGVSSTVSPPHDARG